MITINGKQTEFLEKQTVQDFLYSKDLEPQKVVVELNTKILSHEEWQETILKDGDSLEIISFVGGG